MRSTIKTYKTPCICKEDIHKIVKAITAANITTEESKDSHVRNIQITLQNRELAIANRKCPKCGGNLVERTGCYGAFLGCSNYPYCRFIHKKG